MPAPNTPWLRPGGNRRWVSSMARWIMPAPKNIPYWRCRLLRGFEAEHRALHDPLGEASRAGVLEQSPQTLDRVGTGPDVQGGHVGPTAAERRDHGDALEVLPGEDLGQRELERPVPAVDHEQVDVLARDLRQRFRQRAGAFRLDVEDVRVRPQQRQDPRDLGIAPPDAKVVQDSDSH